MDDKNVEKVTVFGTIKSLFGIFLILIAVVYLFKTCSTLNTPDGKCDKAGCSKDSTCDVEDTEWCLKHYLEMFPLSKDN